MTKVREIKFVPSVCEGEDAKYSGHVVVKALNYYDRIEALKGFNIKINKDRQVEMPENLDQVQMAFSLVKFSEPHYLAVEIQNKETGEKYESFDDLSYDPRMGSVLTEVALFIVNGNQLGNG